MGPKRKLPARPAGLADPGTAGNPQVAVPSGPRAHVLLLRDRALTSGARGSMNKQSKTKKIIENALGKQGENTELRLKAIETSCGH